MLLVKVLSRLILTLTCVHVAYVQQNALCAHYKKKKKRLYFSPLMSAIRTCKILEKCTIKYL